MNRDASSRVAAAGSGPPALCGLLALCAVMLLPVGARAQAETQPYARVIVDSAPVRTGPGATFRRLHMAQRGEVFPIHARSTQGYYLLIELPDSTRGYISGESVFTFEVTGEAESNERFMSWLFATPPLPGAAGEVAVTGGVLGGGGAIALRPSFLLDPAFGLELNAMAVVAPGGRLWIATAGPIFNLLPHAPIVPFATLQGGVTASSPNADTFLLGSGSIATLSAGFGLRLGFHYRLTLRLEARAYAFFEPDRFVAQEEFSAGLTVFF